MFIQKNKWSINKRSFYYHCWEGYHQDKLPATIAITITIAATATAATITISNNKTKEQKEQQQNLLPLKIAVLGEWPAKGQKYPRRMYEDEDKEKTKWKWE